MSNDQGLLLVFAEPGPDVSLDEFTDWYDNEHAPLRLTVPGFHNAIRYKATDAQEPAWMAIYDLESPSIAQSEPYKALTATASDREKALIPRLASVDRRFYKSLSLRTKPDLPSTDPPRKYQYLLVVCLLVPAGADEEFNKWYEEEHVGEIAKVPGWQRCRRYKLVDQVEVTGKVDPAKKIQNYLALHDFDNDDYMTDPQFIAACSTHWTNKMREVVEDIYMRRFVLYKQFQKS